MTFEPTQIFRTPIITKGGHYVEISTESLTEWGDLRRWETAILGDEIPVVILEYYPIEFDRETAMYGHIRICDYFKNRNIENMDRTEILEMIHDLESATALDDVLAFQKIIDQQKGVKESIADSRFHTMLAVDEIKDTIKYEQGLFSDKWDKINLKIEELIEGNETKALDKLINDKNKDVREYVLDSAIKKGFDFNKPEYINSEYEDVRQAAEDYLKENPLQDLVNQINEESFVQMGDNTDNPTTQDSQEVSETDISVDEQEEDIEVNEENLDDAGDEPI